MKFVSNQRIIKCKKLSPINKKKTHEVYKCNNKCIKIIKPARKARERVQVFICICVCVWERIKHGS